MGVFLLFPLYLSHFCQQQPDGDGEGATYGIGGMNQILYFFTFHIGYQIFTRSSGLRYSLSVG